MTQNIIFTSIKFILIDLIGDVLYWPIWWYSAGFKRTLVFFGQALKRSEEILGLRIWFINLFTPMFGQYDWQGRLISFFIRLVQIIVRLVILLILAIFYLILLLAWLILPFFVAYQIWVNFLWLIK